MSGNPRPGRETPMCVWGGEECIGIKPWFGGVCWGRSSAELEAESTSASARADALRKGANGLNQLACRETITLVSAQFAITHCCWVDGRPDYVDLSASCAVVFIFWGGVIKKKPFKKKRGLFSLFVSAFLMKPNQGGDTRGIIALSHGQTRRMATILSE